MTEESLDLPFAETVNYWKTSQSSPDRWLDRAKAQITKLDGRVIREAFGMESGRSAYMLEFEIGMERFRIVWPVLPTRTGNNRAAKIQAVTLLYHDVKARCISAIVLGVRAAFFSYWLLPDGRAASQIAAPELSRAIPPMLSARTVERGNHYKIITI